MIVVQPTKTKQNQTVTEETFVCLWIDLISIHLKIRE